MNRKFYLSLFLVFTLFSLHGCNWISSRNPIKTSKNIISKDFDISNFQQIESNISAMIYITQSKDYAVSVHGPENYLSHLKIFVKGNTLYLNANNFWKHATDKLGKKHVTIHISLPTLTTVIQNGVGNIQIEEKAIFDKLTLRLKGVGDILCDDLTCQQLEATLSGVGKVKLKGKSKSAYYKNSGIGDIQASSMTVSSLTVKHTGVGDITCHATDHLKISASGVGDVTYYGNPSVRTLHKNSVGKIKHK